MGKIVEKDKQISISIKQAAECYKNGGISKELALSAYSEDEIKKYIKKSEKIDYNAVLEKFKKNYPIGTIVYDVEDYYKTYINIITSEPTIKVVSVEKRRYGIVTFQTRQFNPYTGEIVNGKEICSDDCNKLFYDGVLSRDNTKTDDFSYEEFKERLITKFSNELEICKREYAAETAYIKSLENERKSYEESIDKFDERYNNFINANIAYGTK